VKNRLRVLRAERNWSQADLAQRLEVSRQSVNAIETGKFDPSLPLAFRIARLFDGSIESIFLDADSGDAPPLNGKPQAHGFENGG
jgi:putative transcriptional regulator